MYKDSLLKFFSYNSNYLSFSFSRRMRFFSFAVNAGGEVGPGGGKFSMVFV